MNEHVVDDLVSLADLSLSHLLVWSCCKHKAHSTGLSLLQMKREGEGERERGREREEEREGEGEGERERLLTEFTDRDRPCGV